MSQETTILQALKTSQLRSWTDDEIRGFSSTYLRHFVIYAPPAVIPPEAEMARLFAERPPTLADRTFARQVKSSPQVVREAHFKPLEAVTSLGGTFNYTPTELKVSVGTVVVTVPNAPIPAESGIDTSKVDTLAPIMCQIASHKNGKWFVPSLHVWNQILDLSVEYAYLNEFASMTVTMLEQDSVWKSMNLTARNATTGPHKLLFVRDAFLRLDNDTRVYYHTHFVSRVIKAFSKDRSWLRNMKPDGTPLVPEKCFTQEKITPSETYLSMFKMTAPAAYIYRGGFYPVVRMPPNDGTMAQAILTHRKMMEFMNGEDSAVSLLAGMRGFSGLTTYHTKVMQMTVSFTLAAWKQGRIVDIRLSSVGDFPLLASSLNAFHMLCKNAGWKVPDHKEAYRFMSPNRGHLNVTTAQRQYFVTIHRAKAVAIWVAPTNLPTSGDAEEKVNYEMSAIHLFPDEIQNNKVDFIAFMPIYSSIFFPSDRKAQEKNKNKSDQNYGIRDELYVYKYGSNYHFGGVVTTLQNLQMTGYGRAKQGVAWTDKDVLVDLDKEQFTTFSSWVSSVCVDCQRLIVSAFVQVGRYSPISNLLTLSKQALQAQVRELPEEQQQYVHTQVTRPKRERGQRVKSAWGDEDDEEAQSEEEVYQAQAPLDHPPEEEVLATPLSPVDEQIQTAPEERKKKKRTAKVIQWLPSFRKGVMPSGLKKNDRKHWDYEYRVWQAESDTDEEEEVMPVKKVEKDVGGDDVPTETNVLDM